MLNVEVSESSEYSIARTAPSEYVLTLLNAAPQDDSVTEPSFGEATDKIRSARATVEGQNTLVRIFCDPSAYLTARRAPHGLIVEETPNLTTAAEDIRAQIKQDADKKDTTTGETKTATEKAVAADQGVTSVAATKAVDTKPKDAKPVEAQKASVATRKEKGAKPASELEPVELNELQAAALLGNDSTYTGRLISLDLQETDIDNALRIIAEVSNLNIVASEEVTGKVTLRLLDVPWDQALDVILKSNGLDKVLEGNVMRIAPYDKLRQERDALKQARVAQEELAPITVKYVRVSYAKASEIKSLVETVLSERGTVAHDERSNQLIIKDVQEGLKNVTELVKKIDLRTPQVLLETQIVEADRNLARELGSELGFQYIQSPSTGNGTGLNFPSAIAIGGSAGAGGLASSFPVAGSAVSMLFDSADGTKSLEARLSQLEGEGRVRVISRPAVATTNNKAAEIKSVKKIRIPLPNSGNTIGVGSGANANGAGAIATEAVEAGIILNVTPQASPDYYILLDIKAKSSSFERDGLTTLPTEIERSASSTVLVSSGETFALGGIYKILEADTLNGVPFIKDIPFVGTFFRKTTTSNRDEELLFFITPRIVEGSFDDSAVKEKQ
jgi:type IV pilus assembly protein PilQ